MIQMTGDSKEQRPAGAPPASGRTRGNHARGRAITVTVTVTTWPANPSLSLRTTGSKGSPGHHHPVLTALEINPGPATGSRHCPPGSRLR